MPLPAADLHPHPVPPAPVLPKGLSISPAGTRVEGVTQREEAKPMDGKDKQTGDKLRSLKGTEAKLGKSHGSVFLGWVLGVTQGGD